MRLSQASRVRMLYAVCSCCEDPQSGQSETGIINRAPRGVVTVTTKVFFAAVIIVEYETALQWENSLIALNGSDI